MAPEAEPTTGLSPYELMFGRLPRLPVDEQLKTWLQPSIDNLSSFVSETQQHLEYSHGLAHQKMLESAEQFDQPTRQIVSLQVGDEVLVKKVGLQGRSKLADKWEDVTYTVIRQPIESIPVYVVKPVHKKGPIRTLHRNMLRPIGKPHQTNSPSTEASDQTSEENLLLSGGDEVDGIKTYVKEIFPDDDLPNTTFDFDIIIEEDVSEDDDGGEDGDEDEEEEEPLRRSRRITKPPVRFRPS